MKKPAKLFMAVAVLALIASCGGGGGSSTAADGWNTGSENNPTAILVDPAGSTITSVSPNQPVIGSATGLLQNGIYQVAVSDPNGAAVYDQNLLLVTDSDGNLSDSVLAYLGADTQGQAMIVGKGGPVQMSYKDIVAGTYTLHFCQQSVETCDATTASTTATIEMDDTASYVFSADSAGTGTNSFLNETGDVYAVVANGPATTTVDLYVVSNNFQIFSNGDPLPTDVSGATESCTTDAAGACAATLIWENATVTLVDNKASMYDIIVDANQNGVWDEDTDFIDSQGYIAGLAIQEATPSADFGALSLGGSNIITDIACTMAGSAYCMHTNIFSGIDVYGYVNPSVQSLDPHNIAWKFIILHSDSLADGDALTPIQSLGYNHTIDPLQWGCTNENRILLWPASTHVAGCYDVVLDVNQNSIYDAGTDFIDGYSGTCGFIIPGAEGAPALEFVQFTDGANTAVASGGTTSETFASMTFTPTYTGTMKECEVRWAVGDSSSVAELNIDAMLSGESFTTQNVSLFNGTNTVVVTCVDTDNLAGSVSATIESTDTATENIHFQTTLNWQGPASDPGATSGSDMDLHLIMPGGIYEANTDCYYANCQEASGGNTTVGAFLNVDCISQCNGPENIWIPDSNPLTAGEYAVCVDPYSGEGTQLSVSIYNAAGALVETVSRGVLNSTTGGWHVGSYNCTAGTSGTCSWSRTDVIGVAPCPD